MKKIVSVITSIALLCSLLSGCIINKSTGNRENTIDRADDSMYNSSFQSLSDPALLRYVEDSVYEGIVNYYDSEDCIIHDVRAVYISKEYLEELDYNSKSNIWFGYTLPELIEQFQGTPFVFTVGDDGRTIVTRFEEYDDTNKRIIKNIAIGTGVILICVTVTIVSGAVGATTIHAIFSASAKTAATLSLKMGSFNAVTSGAFTLIQTGDVNEALKTAALEGSEGFKWGAIIGSIAGGIGGYKGEVKRKEEIDKLMEGKSEYRKAELRALKEYGGREQVSYLGGKEVQWNTPGATRPDVVINKFGGGVEAIEVKNFNLNSNGSLSTLYRELEREIPDRVKNLPKGSTQRIVLDVTGRGISYSRAEAVKKTIIERLWNVYENIPVDIVGAI